MLRPGTRFVIRQLTRRATEVYDSQWFRLAVGAMLACLVAVP